MKRVITASNSNLLSVFWYYGTNFYGPSNTRDSEEVENYGGFLNLPYDHFTIWDDYKPSGFVGEYDEIPRGRVIYDSRIRKFKVITSKQLCEDDDFKKAVRSEYGLPITTIFEYDEHYC